ncbi:MULTISPECIES: hypothetical protein [Vibrio]|uniref:hypothetical protein n=1 Tax=Vibrio TaxID=662 RepID=UPI0012DAF84C|nr:MULTISPECIES: hypothetical protein [Vibrio]NRF14770.1 hypothetical protein [Vibrio coralliilyticus]QIJ87457.1 hypothetical protein G3U99_24880 [Vibrio coralliilyticus OCN008]
MSLMKRMCRMGIGKVYRHNTQTLCFMNDIGEEINGYETEICGINALARVEEKNS